MPPFADSAAASRRSDASMLICLDYDGVLVDTFDELLAMMVTVQARIGRGRIPLAEDFRTIEQLTFDALARRIGLDGRDIGRFGAGMFELQRQVRSVRPFAGIVRAVESLSRCATLVVVTANHADTVTAMLDGTELLAAITSVSGSEGGDTKAVRIDRARRDYGFDAQRTVMVGDAVSDLVAGREAGVTTAAVTWGYQGRDRLMTASPDIWLHRPADLASLPRMIPLTRRATP